MERDEVFEDENVKKGTLSIEQIFESQPIPSWREQLTLRAFVVSLVLGFFFSFIVMKLNLTTGIIPSLNVAAGLLGFFFLKTWTKLLQKSGMLKQPFTRQENTVIQTCVVATSGIAFSGGFGSYIFGMSETIASQSGDGNKPVNIKNPSLGWMIGFLFVVSFLGLFSVLPLRKIMIIDHKLIYPSGTATAHLINSFHTPHGAKLVKKQVSALFKCFVSSFLWAFFQWFYTAGDDCGFAAFPTFGLQAYQRKFFFDFSATYVGVGMICPYIVNLSLLAGAILSWGIMWPIIEGKKGDWYSEKLSPSSLHGLQGYKCVPPEFWIYLVFGLTSYHEFGRIDGQSGSDKDAAMGLTNFGLPEFNIGNYVQKEQNHLVFIAIAMILGDGLFHFAVVLFKTIHELCIKRAREEPSSIIPVAGSSNSAPSLSYDDHRRTEIFLKDQIPITFTSAGYVILAIVSIVTVPHIFPQLKWYHILVTYLIAPVLAFCNSYGCGLTDWSLASSYGKIAIFIFGAWVGLDNGGVLAGLASCGVMMSIVSTASDLMQDFKTGYMTLSSPRSMFVSQVIGTAMGCVIAPCVFWIFYKAFSIGVDGSDYPAPYATVYRGIALLGVEGVSSLPKNCLTLCLIFFLAAIVMSSLKEVAKHYEMKIFMFMPSVMAMAIPFFLGSYFAIDMCLGSLILFMWERMDKEQADAFAPAVASGIICGDGIWALPASLFALAKVKPPICMKFLSRGDNAKVDAFLSG